MEISGPTILTRWDTKTNNLKYDLTNCLVGLFDNKTFVRAEVLKNVGQHMKIVRHQFRVHLERNPRFEHPPMIPTREWKSLVGDGKEMAL